MPPSNAEIIREAMDAWNRGDWETALRNTAPDVELDNSAVQGEYRGIHRGPAEGRRMFERFAEPWESVRVEIVELVEAGERVFTRMHGRFRGRDGIEVETETGMCWTVRDGVIVRVLMPNEVNEARRAAGLPLE